MLEELRNCVQEIIDAYGVDSLKDERLVSNFVRQHPCGGPAGKKLLLHAVKIVPELSKTAADSAEIEAAIKKELAGSFYFDEAANDILHYLVGLLYERPAENAGPLPSSTAEEAKENEAERTAAENAGALFSGAAADRSTEPSSEQAGALLAPASGPDAARSLSGGASPVKISLTKAPSESKASVSASAVGGKARGASPAQMPQSQTPAAPAAAGLDLIKKKIADNLSLKTDKPALSANLGPFRPKSKPAPATPGLPISRRSPESFARSASESQSAEGAAFRRSPDNINRNASAKEPIHISAPVKHLSIEPKAAGSANGKTGDEESGKEKQESLNSVGAVHDGAGGKPPLKPAETSAPVRFMERPFVRSTLQKIKSLPWQKILPLVLICTALLFIVFLAFSLKTSRAVRANYTQTMTAVTEIHSNLRRVGAAYAQKAEDLRQDAGKLQKRAEQAFKDKDVHLSEEALSESNDLLQQSRILAEGSGPSSAPAPAPDPTVAAASTAVPGTESKLSSVEDSPAADLDKLYKDAEALAKSAEALLKEASALHEEALLKEAEELQLKLNSFSESAASALKSKNKEAVSKLKQEVKALKTTAVASRKKAEEARSKAGGLRKTKAGELRKGAESLKKSAAGASVKNFAAADEVKKRTEPACAQAESAVKRIEGTVQSVLKAVKMYGDVLSKADGLLGKLNAFAPEKPAAEMLDIMLKKAANGDAAAQLYVGESYYYGKNRLEENKSEALKWFTEAAQKGEPKAIYYLGLCNYYGFKDKKADKKESVKYFAKAASQGSADAQYMLAQCYRNGEGAERNIDEAVRLLELSAGQGNGDAAYDLASLYARGSGVPQDYGKAAELYFEAANNGNVKAMKALGDCYYYGRGLDQDYYEAADCYREAAKHSHADAQNALGNCFYYGNGASQSYTEAVTWYRLAGEQGQTDAQNSLVDCYYDKRGVQEGNNYAYYKEALKWYRLGAQRGYAKAECALGDCYYYGSGIEQNYAKAVQWYTKAADKKFADAQSALGDCCYGGYGLTQDYARAYALYSAALPSGSARAQCGMGRCCFYGRGTAQDPQKGIQLFMKAAEQNYVPAQYLLGTVYESGEYVEASQTEAFTWYAKAAKQGHREAAEQVNRMLAEAGADEAALMREILNEENSK